MKPLRFATIGAGFWSRYQLSGWRELPGAECIALCDRDRTKAEQVAAELGIAPVYDDAERMLREQRPDFVDIITSVETHPALVHLVAAHGIPVICQKPMASTLAEARAMVATCRDASVPFFIHENWRWQTPLRQLKATLDSGVIGRPFRARLQFVCSFPVFANQPFLKDLEQFILTDIGSHILDTARFLFGEARSLTCHTHRIHNDIRGEDVATVMLDMDGSTVLCEMSYASRTEYERFPQTFAFVEGAAGSAELATDYWLRVTTTDGTHARRYPPPRYQWADPAYDVVQASIVACNANLLEALRGEGMAETTGEDNLKTAELVFGAYGAEREHRILRLGRT